MSSLKKLKANEQELALGPEDYNNFKAWSFAMAQLHLGLSQQLAGEEVTLSAGIPQIHTWLHSVHLSNVINPRLTWCFRPRGLYGNPKDSCQVLLQRAKRPPVNRQDHQQSESGNAHSFAELVRKKGWPALAHSAA